jgi:hypothetical protein
LPKLISNFDISVFESRKIMNKYIALLLTLLAPFSTFAEVDSISSGSRAVSPYVPPQNTSSNVVIKKQTLYTPAMQINMLKGKTFHFYGTKESFEARKMNDTTGYTYKTHGDLPAINIIVKMAADGMSGVANGHVYYWTPAKPVTYSPKITLTNATFYFNNFKGRRGTQTNFPAYWGTYGNYGSPNMVYTTPYYTSVWIGFSLIDNGGTAMLSMASNPADNLKNIYGTLVEVAK